jgi:hypothetical protein
MALATVDMLRRLGSGVRPGAESHLSRDGIAFVLPTTRGRRESGRTVQLAPGLEQSLPLSEKRLAQITQAADTAEAAGSRTMLVIDDRGAYLVDLPTRMIRRGRCASLMSQPNAEAQDETATEARAMARCAGLLVGVDAVTVIPDDDELQFGRLLESSDGLLNASGTPDAECRKPVGICNASLAHLLAARMSGSAGA